MTNNPIEIIDIRDEDQLPAIMDDSLIALADQAERRIEAINKIKKIVLGVTNQHDWQDMNNKPYLQVSGSEKVARVFGISWDIEKKPTIEDHDDGHFTFIFRGTFRWGPASITAEGSRSSRDPFFSKRGGNDVPPSEIDRRDVRMSAFTNILGNGITRLLGIRNLTWEDVQEGGIKRSDAGKVTYGDSKELSGIKKEIRTMLMDICLDNKKAASDKLEELTTFTNKDGETVPGKKTVDKLSEKQAKLVYDKVKKLHDDFEDHMDIGGEVDDEAETE